MSKKSVVAITALLIGGLVGLQPAAAGVTRMPIDTYAVACLADPGLVWVTGKHDKIVHVRGQVNEEVIFDAASFEVVGVNTVIVNYDLNQQTGSGGVNTTFSGLFYAISTTDPVIGIVAGHFKDFFFTGNVVGRGTGDAKGAKVKTRLQSVTMLPPELLPLLPCSFADLAGVFRSTGVAQISD